MLGQHLYWATVCTVPGLCSSPPHHKNHSYSCTLQLLNMKATCSSETSANTILRTRHMTENLHPIQNCCGNPKSRRHSNIIQNKSGANKLSKNVGDNSKFNAPEQWHEPSSTMRNDSTKYGRQGDLRPVICAPLLYVYVSNSRNWLNVTSRTTCT